jgi:hypothetical protein
MAFPLPFRPRSSEPGFHKSVLEAYLGNDQEAQDEAMGINE